MDWDDLTEKERSVAVLVSKGLRSKQVAEQLFIAPGTVHWHLKNIFCKLGIENRTQLALIAVAEVAKQRDATADEQ